MQETSISELDEKTVRLAKAIPFDVEGKNMKVAFVNPKDKANISLVKKATKNKVEVFMTDISERELINPARIKYFGTNTGIYVNRSVGFSGSKDES